MLITIIKLLNDAFYTTELDLQGNRFRLQFSYNERTATYYLDLFTLAGVPIVYGLALVPDTGLLSQIDLSEYGLTGWFYLIPLSSSTTISPSPTTFGDAFKLLYFYEEK